jgi:hypothetical protein
MNFKGYVCINILYLNLYLEAPVMKIVMPLSDMMIEEEIMIEKNN